MKSKPGEVGHFEDESFLLILSVSISELEDSPVFRTRTGQSTVSPVPVTHGVLKPQQIRPSPDMQQTSELEHCRVFWLEGRLEVKCSGGILCRPVSAHLQGDRGPVGVEPSLSDLSVGEAGSKALHRVGPRAVQVASDETIPAYLLGNISFFYTLTAGAVATPPAERQPAYIRPECLN